MQLPAVEYDDDADVLYVQLAQAEVSTSQNLDDLRIIDYSSDGEVVGIEFVCAMDGVDLSNVPFKSVIEKAIGDSGLKIRALA